MASAEEFKGAIKRLMQQSGSLDIVQAQVRAEILKAIYSGEAPQLSRDGEPETLLINELIREYLAFHGYDAAASIFMKEAHLDDQGLPRACMEENLASCTEHESRLPLLYALLRRTQKARAGTRQASATLTSNC